MDSSTRVMATSLAHSDFFRKNNIIIGRKIDNEISINSKLNMFSSPSRSEPKVITDDEETPFKLTLQAPKAKSTHVKPKRQENPSQGQQGHSKQKSPTIPVKKKKKTKKTKKKAQSPERETITKPKSPSKHMEQIVLQSTQKARIENSLKRQQEQEQRFIRMQHLHNLNQINQQIRISNAQRFVIKIARFARAQDNSQRLPWGANELRLRQIAYQFLEKNSRSKMNNGQSQKKFDDKHRREALGLRFLNEQSESFIQKAIKRSRPDASKVSDHYSMQSKMCLNPLEQPNKVSKKVKVFMYKKRKQIEQTQLQNKVIMLLNRQRKQENLQRLNESVKEIFKTSRSRQPDQMTPQTQQDETAKTKENFSLLYEEYRQNFIKGHIQKQPRESTKKEALKEKFEQLSKRYQSAMINDTSERSKHKNIHEEFILEEEEDPNNTSRQDPFIEEYDDQSLNELARAVQSNSQNYDDQVETESQVEVLHYHYLNEAAKMIQKVWRGYHTRKVLSTYLMVILEQQRAEEAVNTEQTEKEQQIRQRLNSLVEDADDSSVLDSSDIGKILKNNIQDQRLAEQLAKTVETIIEHKVQKILNAKRPSTEVKQERFFNEARRQLNLSKNYQSFVSSEAKRKQSLSPIHAVDSDFSKMGLENQQDQSKDSELDTSQKKLGRYYSQRSSAGSIQSQIQKRELNELLQMRDQSIQLRLKIQMDKTNDLFEKGQLSQLEFQLQCQRIKKWHQQEVEELRNTKTTIELSWKKAADVFKKIQRDLAYTEQLKDNKQVKSIESTEELQRLQKEFNEQLSILQARKQQVTEASSSIKIIDNFEIREPRLGDIRQSKEMFDLNESLRSSQSSKQLMNNDELISQIESKSWYKFKGVILKNDLIGDFQRDIPDKIDELPETFSEMEDTNQLGQLIEDQDRRTSSEIRREFIESDKQLEVYQLVTVITSQLLEKLVDEASQEFIEKGLITEAFYQSGQFQLRTYTVPTSIDHINDYILTFFLYANENFQQDMLRNINTPYGFPPLKRMRLIHGYDDAVNESMNDHSSDPNVNGEVAFVLDESFFLQYEQYKLQLSSDMTQSQFVIREMEHIHNKAIFDACNEALNLYRPYFFHSGIPYPWERMRNLSNCKFSLDDLSPIFEKMRIKVLEWGGFYCGFIDTNEPQEFGNGSQSQVSPEKQKIIEEKSHQLISQQLQHAENPLACNVQAMKPNESEYVQQIREERLHKMLVADVRENEYKWLNHSDDRTEFLMELADILFEGLVEELSRDLLGLPEDIEKPATEEGMIV